jgi:hypothetical protein
MRGQRHSPFAEPADTDSHTDTDRHTHGVVLHAGVVVLVIRLRLQRGHRLLQL